MAEAAKQKSKCPFMNKKAKHPKEVAKQEGKCPFMNKKE
jgi:hypothetical protein